MAAAEGRTQERIRMEIESERTELVRAVDDLRRGLGEATDVAARLRPRFAALTAGALGAGFVAAGGIGAGARLLSRRGRAGKPGARAGRFRLRERR